MLNYLAIVLFSLCCYRIVQTRKFKHPEVCVENQFQAHSVNYLRLCYATHLENQNTLLWFTIGKSLNDTFDFYRFTMRSPEESIPSRSIIRTLTNFTQLIDTNNSLRMFNLDSGLYEVCVEFQSDIPLFVYQPRDGCITIEIGRSTNQSFKHSSTPLLIALASGIVIFFILGLVVQWWKEKRRKRFQDDEENPPTLTSSNILSAKTLKQRDHVIRKFLRQNIDRRQTSRMYQWAHNRAFRHRISVDEQEFERPNFLKKWGRNLLPSTDSLSPARPRHRMPTSEPILTRNNIYTISEDEHELETLAECRF